MKNQRKYLNFLDIEEHSEGNERRYEMLSDILKNGTFLPKTLEYKDIDQSFTEWVKSLTIITDEGREFPTITLFSNQRFSEYSQTWQSVDENKNLLLNFKTITRENNPEGGKIQNGLWNIPGDRFYLIKRKIVLDNNGTESFLDLEMKQPVAIDFMYKVGIFTTKFESINEFNTKINKLFAARQVYIQPNGHYIPMILESISDTSQYNIDDRQFYAQTYQIKVMGYIITEDDYRIEERPMKFSVKFGDIKAIKRQADVEIEDICPTEEYNPYYYKPIRLTIHYDKSCNKGYATFTIDEDMVIIQGTTKDIRDIIEVEINGERKSISVKEISEENKIIFKNGDEIKINVIPMYSKDKTNTLIFDGYNPTIVYSDIEDNKEIPSQKQEWEEKEIPKEE